MFDMYLFKQKKHYGNRTCSCVSSKLEAKGFGQQILVLKQLVGFRLDNRQRGYYN